MVDGVGAGEDGRSSPHQATLKHASIKESMKSTTTQTTTWKMELGAFLYGCRVPEIHTPRYECGEG